MVKLYDKRDDFKFKMVSFPYISSNIPNTPAYGVFTAQLLRIYRVCTSLSDANLQVIQLSSKLSNQGYKVMQLAKSGKRMLMKHQWICRKFDTNATEMVQLWKNTWIWVAAG